MMRQKFYFIFIQFLAFAVINSASPNFGRLVSNRNDDSSAVIGTKFRYRRESDLSNSNEDDLNSIKQAIYEKYTAHNCDFKDLNVNFVLKKLYEKRRNGDPKKQDRATVFERHGYVMNNNPEVREILSDISLRKNFTGTNIISIEKTKGFTVNADSKIEIPFIVSKVQIGEEFGQNDTFTKKIERFTDINSDDIKADVQAFSKVKISVYVYKYVDVHNYWLDFELDEKSSISCASDIRHLRDFLPNGYYGTKGLQLEHMNGKFIIKNIPASETIVSFGIRTKFGTDEKM